MAARKRKAAPRKIGVDVVLSVIMILIKEVPAAVAAIKNLFSGLVPATDAQWEAELTKWRQRSFEDYIAAQAAAAKKKPRRKV